MTFRFLHTSDWHIGKPYGRFPIERAGILRRARLTAIDRLAAAARAGGASVILVAGDVFDGPGLPNRTLLELSGKLAAHPDLHWYLMPGNHDPATPAGLWDRLARFDGPPNIHVCREPKAMDVAPGVVLLPAPLTAKALSQDPTSWFASSPSREGAIRIGLAHGSTQGFGSESTTSISITPTRARDAGLQYLALGDWHGTREVAPSTWYSGTPEPDGFQDNDPGNVLLVTISGPGAPARIERCPTAEMTWLSRRLSVRSTSDLSPLLAEIAAAGEAACRMLIEIALEGEVALADDADIRSALAQKIDPKLFHLECQTDRLVLAPAADDLAALHDPALRQIAQELSRAAQSPGPDAAVAALALRRLYCLARAEGATA
jgi:DNA repair exonuclease SbcCD nuclease subunit